MTAKSLVKRFFTPICLERLHFAVSRSFNPACIINTSTRSHHTTQFNKIEGDPSKLLLVAFTKRAEKGPSVLSGNLSENVRKLHTNACLMGKSTSEVSKPREIEGITYSVVPRDKSDVIVAFMMDNYQKLEPVTKALAMPLSELDGWFPEYMRLALASSPVDVSVEAFDKKANLRVGTLASIIVDPELPPPPSLPGYLCEKKHPVNKAMWDMYTKLEEGLNKSEVAGVGSKPVKRLEHLFLSTTPNYAGRGISNYLVEMTEDIAATVPGVKLGYAVATSAFSYKVFLKYGYKQAQKVVYADYKDAKGHKLLGDKAESMKPHVACRSMVKRLPGADS